MYFYSKLIPVLILTLLIFINQTQAQNELSFFDSIEFLPDNKLKFYSNGGQLVKKKCAEFYRIARLDTVFLGFDGKVQDFYPNGKLAFEANYIRGFIYGQARVFYPNGVVQEEGIYKIGKAPEGYFSFKDSIWVSRYKNGVIKKMIQYEQFEPKVLELNNKSGKALIVNGNGRFRDVVVQSHITGVQYSIRGDVRNGVKDGEWTVRLDESQGVYLREYYENGKFIRGESYAGKLGKQPIYQSSIRLSDVIEHEHFDITHVPICVAPFKYKKSITLMGDIDFEKKLQAIVYKLFKSHKMDNAWLIMEFKSDNNYKVNEFEIISCCKNINREEIIKSLKSEKIWKPESSSVESKYLSIRIVNGNLVD